jgi:hypothetical protein
MLRRDWIKGTEAAFNGRSGSAGIVSIADVFRPGTPTGTVLDAWQRDAVSTTSGSVEPLPANAPGAQPVLIKGTVLKYGILLYMWRDGTTIASVELVGKAGSLPVPELMTLARRQQSKISGLHG